VERLGAITRTIERGVLVLAALLAGAVLLIVGNTIRLEIQNRHSEIEIVKLVGGTDAFIRRPFLYEGIWYGLLGAAIGMALVLGSLYLLDGPVRRLAGLYESGFELSLVDPASLLGVVLGGPMLGLAGAWLAVGRHLARIQPE
jgi:cell division transport system permease protein